MKYLSLTLLFLFFINTSCHRADEDEDVLSQEDISNIILSVTDDSGKTVDYDYSLNSIENPIIRLENGKTYQVKAKFLNGNEDETESIIKAKNEHFLIYNFIDSEIKIERESADHPENDDVREDGNRVGLYTKWTVAKAENEKSAELILTLIHAANSVSEAQNGTAWGSTIGGETDAEAVFGLSN